MWYDFLMSKSKRGIIHWLTKYEKTSSEGREPDGDPDQCQH